MNTIETTYFGNGGFAVVTPNVALIIDYTRDTSRKLPELLSKHPAIPVIFLVTHSDSTHFNPEIFSMGEMRQRYYVLPADVAATGMPDGILASAVSPGSILPDLPGGVTITVGGDNASGLSYLIATQSHHAIYYTASPDPAILDGTDINSIDVAIVRPRNGIDTASLTTQMLLQTDVKHLFTVGFSVTSGKASALPAPGHTISLPV